MRIRTTLVVSTMTLIQLVGSLFSFAAVGNVWGQGHVPSKVIQEEVKPSGMSDEEWEKLKAKRPLPFDNGPSTIDISKYPPEMKDIYTNVFTQRCSKCHTIARPINAPYALPEEWNKYIKKMMKKPGSGISPSTGKQIAKFLIYDSQVRKAAQIEKKLKEIGSQKPGKQSGD